MLVFGVKYRLGLITRDLRPNLHAFIGSLIKNHGNGSSPIRIGGTADHIHVLMKLSPKISIAEIAREIKSRSSRWINENKLIMGRFAWQTGYSAFSYSSSAREDVIRYIDNQEEHHKRYTFREEIERLLKLYDIDFDPRDLPQQAI